MPHIKTAISIDEAIFKKMDNLSHKIHISRSRLFEEAAAAFLQKKTGPDLLEKLNKVYSDGPAENEKEWLNSAADHHRKLLKRKENKW